MICNKHKDYFEAEAVYQAVDDVVQEKKWKQEKAEREVPKELSLSEFLLAFEMIEPEAKAPPPSPTWKSFDSSAGYYSPILDGTREQSARERRARLAMELETATPVGKPFVLPPPFSEA